MAARIRYGKGSGKDFMDLTDTDEPYNTIIVEDTRVPVVEGMTIDRAMMGPDRLNPMGQFRPYSAMTPRPVGVSPGGERTVVTDRGAGRLMAADRRLMEGGFGGVHIMDGQFAGTDEQGSRSVITKMPEGFAPVMTNDQRLAMSPEAVSIMGDRQLQEEKALQRGPFSTQAMGNRMSIRKELQAKADQGFVAPGTDARNRETMRSTEERQADLMLKRSRPRDLMARRNTADQIMTQADASLMTPQIQVQDGVMAGWDPINRKIVSDSSGAQAMADARAPRIPDKSLEGEDDKTILEQISKMTQRKNGKLDENQAIIYSGLMKSDPKQAAEYKQAIVGTWTPEDDQIYQKYIEHGVNRGLISTQKPAQGGGAAKPGSKYEKMKR